MGRDIRYHNYRFANNWSDGKSEPLASNIHERMVRPLKHTSNDASENLSPQLQSFEHFPECQRGVKRRSGLIVHGSFSRPQGAKQLRAGRKRVRSSSKRLGQIPFSPTVTTAFPPFANTTLQSRTTVSLDSQRLVLLH